MLNPIIRPETEAEHAAIHAVNAAAFPTSAEADLVDRLRENGKLLLSLVAEVDGEVVGHAAFSPATIAGCESKFVALGPIAVHPKFQIQGIGGQLIRAGHEYLCELGVVAAFLVGHPTYYPRHGYREAGEFNLRWERDLPLGVFQAIELVAGALSGVKGTVVFSTEFAEV